MYIQSTCLNEAMPDDISDDVFNRAAAILDYPSEYSNTR